MKVLTRTEAAQQAGMSERQKKTALRVANVPKSEFEQAIESEKPPTLSQLADAGTQKKTPLTVIEGTIEAGDTSQTNTTALFDLGDVSESDFQAETALMGMLERCADEFQRCNI